MSSLPPQSPPALVTMSRRLTYRSASRVNSYYCSAPVLGYSFSYIISSASPFRTVLERQGALFNGSGICAQMNSGASEEGKAVDFNDNEQKLSFDAGESNGNNALKGKFSSHELMVQLKRYGAAGVLSYGLLNTVYYLVTFLSVWFYISPAPGKLGYTASVKRFVKIMAAVWAGSQVTKLLRAAGALALAPIVEKGLSWYTVKFKFNSKRKAFAAIAGMCFGLAFLLFMALTLLWA